MTDKVIQLFKRPLLSEYQGMIEDWYNEELDVFFVLTATRENEGIEYQITYTYEADSDEDFVNILKNIIGDILIKDIKEK